MKRKIFAPSGQALAMDPRAYGLEYEAPPLDAASSPMASAAVLAIRGPLEAYASPFFDSYSDINHRAAEAIGAGITDLVMDISSPGGLVERCFESARQLRAMCDASGVRLHAYVGGRACSAAYAYAVQADPGCLVVAETAEVGSIGVRQPLIDATAADAAAGVAIEWVTSGDRKADGDPSTPITDGARAAYQRRVNAQAAAFYRLVGERRGMAPDAVAALKADVFTGLEAVALGLADRVGSFDSLLASIASGSDPEPEKSIVTKDEMRAALKAKAEDGEEWAKAALKAMDGEEDDEKEPKSAAKAEGGPPPKEEDDEGEAKASAVSDKTLEAMARAEAARMAAEAQEKAAAKAQAKADAQLEKVALVQSRPNMSADLRSMCLDPETSVAAVRKVVEKIPAPASIAERAEAGTTVATVRGVDQGGSATPAHVRDFYAGFTQPKAQTYGVRREGNKMLYGVPVTEATAFKG